jgi:hypothetical protein
MNRKNCLWLRWITANGIGEMLGLAIAAGIDLLCFKLLNESVAGLHGLVFLAIVLTAGFLEGVLLGFFQMDTLVTMFPSLNHRAWLVATGIGVSLSWFIGITVGNIFVPTLMKSSVDNMTGLILFSILVGGIFGAVIGFCQWLVFKKCAIKTGLWIIANALAYPCGVFVLFGAILLSHHAGQPDIVFSLGAIAGLVSGSLIGVITGRFLIFMADTPVAQTQSCG